MPDRTGRTGQRTARRSKRRRTELRRARAGQPAPSWRDWFARPEMAWLAAVAIGYVAVVSAIIAVSRGQPLLAAGRVLDDTLTVRVQFSTVDDEATDRVRDIERIRVGRVYIANRAVFDELDSALRTLPAALAAADSFDAVEPAIRAQFGLTPDSFASIRAVAVDGQAPPPWTNAVDRLLDELRDRPIVSAGEYQLLRQDPADRMRLVFSETEAREVSELNALVLASNEGDPPPANLADVVRGAVARAGFAGPAADAVGRRLLRDARPTFSFDRAATTTLQDDAAERVEPVEVPHRPGDAIALAGLPLEQDALELADLEHDEWRATLPPLQRWLSLAGIVGIVVIVAAAVTGYLGVFHRSLSNEPGKLAALAGFSALLLVLACWGAVTYPAFAIPATLSPAVFLGMMTVVAFGRRLAILVAGAQAILGALALDLGIGSVVAALFAVMLAGWRLNAVRSRNDVVRGGLVVAAGLAIVVLILGFAVRPPAAGVPLEILADAAGTGLGGFVAVAILLVALPTIERAFDVTTGMTLSELRDPKHPLLRQLQQRAPGTYNHSLNVATLCESAAESIGADGLHVYVGALYHDIGKMNKPEYFVENQPRGFNKHEKLSPAMSLLVIVGHVKDGVELAREYDIPRSLHHYIEAHHGTTLVEYFFDRAKRQADADDQIDRPAEVEYRYPGPRPRTREAAIMMLCDTVESATRAMPDPTPARISALVHELANKRLIDGQFDECALTLRELTVVCGAISKSLAAIYHGRIAYPKHDTHDAHAKRDAAAG